MHKTTIYLLAALLLVGCLIAFYCQRMALIQRQALARLEDGFSQVNDNLIGLGVITQSALQAQSVRQPSVNRSGRIGFEQQNGTGNPKAKEAYL